MAPSSTIGAVMPQVRNAPTKVVVFQCPWGTGARQRSPRGARPHRRAILVDAPVSSMKTRRSGANSGWASNQARRRRRTLARCCSLACAVFFERHPVQVEQPPDRALSRLQPVRLIQMLRQFAQGDVGGLADHPQDLRGMGFETVRAVIPALRARPDIAGAAPLIDPFDRCRGRDSEPPRRRSARHATCDRRDKPSTNVARKRSRHAGWPPSPAHILNQNSKPRGIPYDSVSSEIALVNLAVIAAGAGVWASSAAWPDIAVAAVI